MLSVIRTRVCGYRPPSTSFIFGFSRSLSSGLDVSDASAVVIGGGAIGTSIAYHLGKKGLKDVILLERGEIAKGITQHSPGMIGSAHPVTRYKPILAYSVQLYSQLEEETGVKINFETPGTLRLARSPQRVDEFRTYTARDYYRTGDSCRTTFVEPERIQQLYPLLKTDSVLGGLYTEGDGYLDATALTQALAAGAKAGGVRLIENCKVENVTLRADGYWDVETTGGTIKTLHVVNAAGLWARDVGLTSGVDLPLVHMEHQYAVLGPVQSLKNLQSPLPALVDHDAMFYTRRHGDNMYFGAFERAELVTILRDWSLKRVPDDVDLEAKFERLKEPYEKACELIDGISEAKAQSHAGAFCMTSDTFPLVGLYVGLPRYWVAAGFLDGIASAGGIGHFLADFIMNGEPPKELFDADANRFTGLWATKKYLLEKSKESYAYVYNWGLPAADRTACRPTSRVSGIYGALKLEGAQMKFRAGWETPAYFTISDEDELSALAREYQMVTNKCGIVDLSYKGKVEVSGPDSTAFLNYCLTGDPPGYAKVSTSLMLSKLGRILASFKILHHDYIKSEYILLTDPEHELRDIRWMERIISEQNFNAQVHAVSEYLASLAIVGPKSRDVLSALTKTDLSSENFPHATLKQLRISGIPCIASRASATGELSWELFHNRADTLKLYEVLMQVGRAHGLVNFGTSTLNTLRIEKGFKMWGHELSIDANPIEVGMESFVNMDKGDFVGRLALTETLKKAQTRRLALLQVESSESILIPTDSEVVRRHGDEEMIGQVTSGCYSVKLQKPLCFAWLSNEVSDSETFSVDLGSERAKATVLDVPPAVPAHGQ